MSAKNEHHYVPQFFFRNFSDRPNPTTIHGLLTRYGTVKFDISIRNQSKRHKLYLTWEIEDALSLIEGGMSSCLHSVIRNATNFAALRESQQIMYWMAGAFLLQSGRVPVRGQRFHDALLPMFEEVTVSQLIADPRTPPDLRDGLARGELGVT